MCGEVGGLRLQRVPGFSQNQGQSNPAWISPGCLSSQINPTCPCQGLDVPVCGWMLLPPLLQPSLETCPPGDKPPVTPLAPSLDHQLRLGTFNPLTEADVTL